MRFLLVLLCLPSFALADVLIIESAPTAVEVQSGQAQVTRVVRFEMPAGQHEIVLPDVPDGALT